MQCHPSLYYVMYLGTLSFAVQFNVFISLLWFLFIVYYLVLWFLFIVYYLFFSDVVDNEHSYLVDIPVERSIFKCNIQKSVPRSLQLKNIMLSSRIEICS